MSKEFWRIKVYVKTEVTVKSGWLFTKTEVKAPAYLVHSYYQDWIHIKDGHLEIYANGSLVGRFNQNEYSHITVDSTPIDKDLAYYKQGEITTEML